MTAPAMIVLRRGDRVLITLTDEPDDVKTIDYVKGLTDAFPGVEFVVMTGVQTIAVQSDEHVT